MSILAAHEIVYVSSWFLLWAPTHTQVCDVCISFVNNDCNCCNYHLCFSYFYNKSLEANVHQRLQLCFSFPSSYDTLLIHAGNEWIHSLLSQQL